MSLLRRNRCPGQAQDQLLLRGRNRPGHGAPEIAMTHPVQAIGLVATLEPLYLTLAQMPQAAFSITFTR